MTIQPLELQVSNESLGSKVDQVGKLTTTHAYAVHYTTIRISDRIALVNDF